MSGEMHNRNWYLMLHRIVKLCPVFCQRRNCKKRKTFYQWKPFHFSRSKFRYGHCQNCYVDYIMDAIPNVLEKDYLTKQCLNIINSLFHKFYLCGAMDMGLIFILRQSLMSWSYSSLERQATPHPCQKLKKINLITK